MSSQKLARRDALKIAAGAALAPAVVSMETRAAADAVAYGMIGCGGRGRELLNRAKSLASGRCAAVCDVDDASLTAARQASGAGPKPYREYRALLNRSDIPAVFIATPQHTHFAIARDALLAGKHVFIESPVVFKPAEVAALRSLAQERPKQVVQSGLPRRYSRFYQTAYQMVSKGLLSEVTHVFAQAHSNPGVVMRADQAREKNWKLFREFSGGLTSQLTSQQIDVADWMFGEPAEFVSGVGGLDWKKDGRDVYDNIAITFKYPFGQTLVATALTTNKHLPLFGGTMKAECAEVILGTNGTLELTLGSEQQPALGLWFIEPGPRIDGADDRSRLVAIAGATVARSDRPLNGFPILLDRDQISGQESFFERELKYARRWLYAKGIAVPQEERDPTTVQLESFFECCRTGRTPKADLEAGLNNSVAVILANLAMDEGRHVRFDEFDKLARGAEMSKPS